MNSPRSPRAVTAARVAILAAAYVFTSSCGGDATTPKPPAENPTPVLQSVSPNLILVGSDSATVTMSGSGFNQASRARWNDQERPTSFVGAGQLKVVLSAGDLSSASTGSLTVVNPAPGGGTSSAVSVDVGYPPPVVTAVSPDTVVVNTGAYLTVTITGSGFLPTSTARWAGEPLITTVVSSTTLRTVVSPIYFRQAGEQQVTVVNPPPGGGASPGINFVVMNPPPRIASLTPDSATTGSAFTLSVNGSGFAPTSIVRWNGSDRPTKYVGAAKLTAAITAADVAQSATASITVYSPPPVGGTAPAAPMVVRPAPQTVTSVNPGTITAGAAGATLTINGTRFSSSTAVLWNGTTRPSTLVSPTTITAQLTAADVATAASGAVSLLDSGSGLSSNGVVVAILPAKPAASVVASMVLRNNAVVYDSTRGVVYASVPSTSTQYANSIVKIDPASGTILGGVVVGSDPGAMAISDDDRYLYVALRGAPDAVRVDLSTFSRDIDFALGASPDAGPFYGQELFVLPGMPHSVAISRRDQCCSPAYAGVVVYDDGVPRPNLPVGENARITRGADAKRLYAYDDESTAFELRRIIVAADGLSTDTTQSNLVSGFGVGIAYDGGFIYSSNGAVINAATLARVGTIPSTGNGVVVPDARRGRVHFLANSQILTVHYTALTNIGSFVNLALDNLTSMCRWGSDGLAAGGGAYIVFIRGSQIGP